MVNSNLAYQDIEVEIPQIKDEPVKWCTVALSEVLQNGHRLEASVYDAETRQAKITIQNSKYALSQNVYRYAYEVLLALLSANLANLYKDLLS